MQPYTLMDLILPFQTLTQDVALYLPRTADLRQLSDLTKDDEKISVVHYCMEGASKVSRAEEWTLSKVGYRINSFAGALCIFRWT